MPVTAPRDIEAATVAAECVTETHFRLVDFLKSGQTLAEIDTFVADTLQDLGCRSAFLRYRIPGHPPFPSHSCLSPNTCIVHGTHDLHREPMKPGDILSIDIGVVKNGWMGDAAWTYAFEHAADDALALMKAGRESLAKGVAAIQPGRPLADWARAVQHCVETEHGFHLVQGLGGHGYGRKLHGPPFISNVMPKHEHEWPDAWTTFKPGMLIAVEPMLGLTTGAIRTERKGWPIWTADDSLAVHYEADVLIQDGSAVNLTAGMANLPDIVGV